MQIQHQIHHPNNIMKTTWNIIKYTTGSSHPYNPIATINTDIGSTAVPDEIAKAFNDFFYSCSRELR